MRIILLLAAVAIVGLAGTRWLSSPSAIPASTVEAQSRLTPPPVPTRPQELKTFSKDLDRFMQDTAAQRARQEPDQ